ncbi:oxidoreductase, short chain dehydrogenase/reductase family [Akanthomyces lecanii RCEF 1005]|uniref:Oxidoreductase, short chain dehydrogenase/reductase family n=1 Tax=Akanthomyces lecanii RCEF 1005 TaxID=1081108 RepID=A0A167ZMQ6_CORDF|nr:oxidoreductase, short chain dehydrogenase/reductase family [Akanthomyces lecanii RCEF 1005]
MAKPIAIIAGAGPGTGAAIARRFARAYPVVLLSRSQGSLDPLVAEIEKVNGGGSAVGIPTDVTDKASMASAMDKVRERFGGGDELVVAAAVYNVASKFTRRPFLEQSEAEFMNSLEPSIKGAYNFAQATLPLMKGQGKQQYPPTLIFTGATASVKGGSGLAAFAMSKFGIRAMAQSLAREFGPQGVHVSHVIMDGVIDTEKTKEYSKDIPDSKIDPAGIAESYWFLHTQPRAAFTHEIDIRPYVEKW